jgi:indole-3-glycerol phosphate synthase
MRFLERIIRQKKSEVATKCVRVPLEALRARPHGAAVRDFAAALRGGVRIIAEIKKRSPRVARFRQASRADLLAPVYEAHGAAAISVVTDAANFGTSLADAQRSRRMVSLPVLVKDFFVDPYQIYEARAHGADAVLLIARLLDERTLRSLYDLVRGLGMHALVEVHDRADLARAKACGAGIIGINNRDLDNFQVSIDTTRALIAEAGDATVVAESGIGDRQTIEELSALGVDAFLIGGALLQSEDPGALLSELLGETPPNARRAE